MREITSPTGPGTANARLVLLVLLRHAKAGSCFVGTDTLAEETLLGIHTVRRAIRVLKASGWLGEERSLRFGAIPTWTLHLPQERPAALPSTVERRARRAPQAEHGCSPSGARMLPNAMTKASTGAPEGEQRRDHQASNGGRSLPHGTPPQRTPPRTPPSEIAREQSITELRAELPLERVAEPVLRLVPASSARERPAIAPRKSRRPPGWIPSAKHREKARALGFGEERLELEADHFRDHHDAKGSIFADWDAAFSGWLRNARSFDDRRGIPREDIDEPLFDPRTWKPERPPTTRTPEEEAGFAKVRAEAAAAAEMFAQDDRDRSARQAALLAKGNGSHPPLPPEERRMLEEAQERARARAGARR